MDHFSKTAPPKRKLALGINDGPNRKLKKEDEGTKGKGNNTPFRRVITESIEVNPNLKDNSANTSFDTWGARVSSTGLDSFT